MAKAKSKFYAVAKGKHPDSPGIYMTWTEAKCHVHGESGARHHSFPTREQAQRWLEANRESAGSAPPVEQVMQNASTTRSDMASATLATAPISSSLSSSSATSPKHEQDHELDSCTWYLCATKSAEEVIAREQISYFYRDVAVPLGNIPDVPIGAYDTRPPPRRFFDSDEEDETDDEEDALFLHSLLSACRPSVWEEEEYIPLSPGRSPPSTPLPASGRRKKRKPTKFYAVPVGHLPGVYRTWADTEVQLIGFTDSYCKSNKDEGMAWLYYFSRYKRPRDYSDDEDAVGGVVIKQDELETGNDLLASTTSPEPLYSRSSSRSSSPQLLPASSPPTSSPGHYYGPPAPPLEGPCVPRRDAASRNDDFYNSEDEFADDDSQWIDNVPGEELDRLEVQLLTSQQTVTCSGASACTSEGEFADADADSEWMDYLTDDEMGQIDSQQSS